MTSKFRFEATRLNVPQKHGIIRPRISTDECLAIRTEGYTIDAARMTSKFRFEATRLNVPQKHRLVPGIPTCTGKCFTIWTEQYLLDLTFMREYPCGLTGLNVPQKHLMCIVYFTSMCCTCKRLAIRTKQDAIDAAHPTGEFRFAGARGNVPQMKHCTVPNRTCERFAIRTERYTQNDIRMRCPFDFTGRNIPQKHCISIILPINSAQTGKCLAIRTERYPIDRTCTTGEFRFEATHRNVPQTHRPVPTCTGKCLAIWTERHTTDFTCVLGEGRFHSTCRNVP